MKDPVAETVHIDDLGGLAGGFESRDGGGGAERGGENILCSESECYATYSMVLALSILIIVSQPNQHPHLRECYCAVRETYACDRAGRLLGYIN